MSDILPMVVLVSILTPVLQYRVSLEYIGDISLDITHWQDMPSMCGKCDSGRQELSEIWIGEATIDELTGLMETLHLINFQNQNQNLYYNY